MHAILISIGDELVLGQTVDTNSAWLAVRLASIGIPCLRHDTVADDAQATAAAITLAARDADVVLITGGLGPTDDDLTRQALAAAMGVSLIEDGESLSAVESYFAGRGRPMPQRNRVQAMHPAGSTMIPNTCGTAPGIRAELHGTAIYVMPGVPREMKTMYDRSVKQELVEMVRTSGTQGVILTTKVNTFGWGESTVAEALGELMDRDRNPKVGTTVANGFVSVRIRSEFADPAYADDRLNDTLRQVNQRLGAIVFGDEEETLEGAVVALLERRGRRLVTIESCTGGLIAQMITNVPGCSAVYPGGWVVYSNALKMQQLDVPRHVLDTHGAVSEETVRLLARNALLKVDADISLSVSGIAGPGGGTEDKPIGTVWLGMGLRDIHDPSRIVTSAVLLNLGGEREAIRDRAAKSALQMLRFHMLDQPLDLLHWVVRPTIAVNDSTGK